MSETDLGEDAPVYCAACYAELDTPCEEWECPKCGKPILLTKDYITRDRLNEINEKADAEMRDWIELNKKAVT